MALTLKEITEQMRGFRDLKSDVTIKKLVITPAVGVKTVTYQATAVSKTEPGLTYKVVMKFMDVEFSREKGRGMIGAMIKTLRRKIFFAPPTQSDSPVKLFCQCMDFRFVWQFPLSRVKSLIGTFKRYTPVPGSNRPPRNPEDIPGMCTHLINFSKALLQNKALK